MKQKSSNILSFSWVLIHGFLRWRGSKPIFLEDLHETVRNEPAKSSSSLGAIEWRLKVFYGRQDRNQTIFSIFHEF